MTPTLKEPRSSSSQPDTFVARDAVRLPVRMPGASSTVRFLKGMRSILELPILGLGMVLGWMLRGFRTAERHDEGLVIVLPGIEGQSGLNHNIVWGLGDGGIRTAIRIFDWTTRIIVLLLVHLRWKGLHRRSARRLAEQILKYQFEYPGRPVTLIGHSGGGAMSILTLLELPEGCQVDRVILLAGALSTDFNLVPALRRVKEGIWNFYSPFDFCFLGLGTATFGTLDGRWNVACGNSGFSMPANISDDGRVLYAEKLHQQPFTLEMAASFNLGGHMGCVNRVFVAEWVAPLVATTRAAEESSREPTALPEDTFASRAVVSQQ